MTTTANTDCTPQAQKKTATRWADIDFSFTLPLPTIRDGTSTRTICIQAHIVGPQEAPVIVVLGGISANRHVCDAILPRNEHQAGWWQAIAGPNRPLNTQTFRLLSFDFFSGDQLAQAPKPDVQPEVQAHILKALCEHLQISQLHAFVGASYGGMVGLHFARLFPERLQQLIVACAAHRPHPLGAAWRNIQRKIVHLGLEAQQPERALSLARELGMTTYRTAEEFGQRFRSGEEVEDYLENRGNDFLKKMSPARYLCLSKSIDLHQIDPTEVRVPTTVIGFRQDQLVPIDEVRQLKNQLPQLQAYFEFDSLYGHDAFLKEASLMAEVLQNALQP